MRLLSLFLLSPIFFFLAASSVSGYTLHTSAPECSDAFVDISATGTPVLFNDDDDGGTVVSLAAPFEFYGESVTQLVMSSNGYLALADTLTAEDGTDFSNDSTLPAIPGNPIGTPARMMVYHDALTGAESGGAWQQYFASCPRPADGPVGVGDEQACTIFQWDDWQFELTADALTFQAVLYHKSFEIVFHLGTGDTSAGASATFGVQDAQARRAVQFVGTVAGPASLCFFEPRFPADGLVADLSVKMRGSTDTVEAGGEMTYQIAASNSGPSPIEGAVVRDEFPEGMACSWTCTASPGAQCAAAGAGDLVENIDLGPGTAVEFTVTCNVSAQAAGTLVNTVQVDLPESASDPALANNVASVDVLVQGGDPNLFTDGFETGDTAAWSTTLP